MFRVALFVVCMAMSGAVAAAELTGLWVGYYAYPSGERVPMSMVLQAGEIDFIGEMIEPQTTGESLDVGQRSILAGARKDRVVEFEKAYYKDVVSMEPFRLREGASVVRYELMLSGNGNELFGKWFIGDMSGAASFKRVTPETVDRLR
ncbi:MAG: hypothetical protein R3270_10780 [Gammaproteobacteria bacterium]|nr:hypothetical protein [Gammaproteobacteria bacterium]